MKFLVVCEGPSDFGLLERIAADVSTRAGELVEMELLEPVFDETSGRHRQHGWAQVIAWCTRQGRSWHDRGRDVVGQTLAFKGADAVLVQVDADIASCLPPSVALPVFDDAEAVAVFLDDALRASTADTRVREQCWVLVAARQIESWLLGTFDESSCPALGVVDVGAWEAVVPVEQSLLCLGYEEDRETPGRLYKSRGLYSSEGYAGRIMANRSRVEARFPRLAVFLGALEEG